MRWAYLLLGFAVGLVAAQAVKFPDGDFVHCLTDRSLLKRGLTRFSGG